MANPPEGSISDDDPAELLSVLGSDDEDKAFIISRYAELGRISQTRKLTDEERELYRELTDWVNDFKTMEKYNHWRQEIYYPKYLSALKYHETEGCLPDQAKHRATRCAVIYTAHKVGLSERGIRKAFHLRKKNKVADIIQKFAKNKII